MNLPRRLTWILVGVLVVSSVAAVEVGREMVSWRPFRLAQGLSYSEFVLSPNGRYLASSDGVSSVRIIDLHEGVTRLLPGTQQAFGERNWQKCVFSADGLQMAIAKQRDWIDVEGEAEKIGPVQVEILALPSFKRLSLIEPREDTTSYTFRLSPRLDKAFSLGYGDSEAWELRSGRHLRAFPPPVDCGSANDWAFSPDGSRFVVEDDTMTTLHRTSDGQRLLTFPKPVPAFGSGPCCPTMSLDNALVMDTDGTSRARCMDVRTAKILWQRATATFAFAPDSLRVATVEGAQINVCNARTGKVVRALATPPKQSFTWVAWTPDGNFVLAATRSGTVWRLRAR